MPSFFRVVQRWGWCKGRGLDLNKPFDKKTLPGKWVFDQKFDANGQ